MPRLLAVQHTMSEFLGAVEAPLEAGGIGFRYVRTVAGDEVAGTPTQHDALWLLGAAHAPADAERCPWVESEARLVRAFQRAGRPVIGTGAGAQVLAAAMGATLREAPGPVARIATAVAVDEEDPLARAVHGRRVLVMHDGSCDVPPGATVVVADEDGRWLAIRTQPPGYGLLFRPELKPGMLEDMAMEDDRPLTEAFGDFVRDVREAWPELEEGARRASGALIAALGLMDERAKPRVIPIAGGR